MTIFAVICAAIFPVVHTGRPWLGGYLFPYPNQHGLWVNFTSPLVWDVFAVSTYFTVSLVFWYVGLIPDFASLRDRTVSKLRKQFILYSVLAGDIQTATGSIMKKLTCSLLDLLHRWFFQFIQL
jgi:hypothetical protein